MVWAQKFNNIVLRMKAVNPDIVIPANYYNEYALLVRTMQQQKVTPKAIYSVLGGAASSYKFVKEFPDAANGIIDCNHWFNPKDKRSHELKKRAEAKGLFFSYELFMTYTSMMLLADAIDRKRARAGQPKGAVDADAPLAGRTLAMVFENRSRDHARNAYWMRFEPEQLIARAGQGIRQGFGHAGPLNLN